MFPFARAYLTINRGSGRPKGPDLVHDVAITPAVRGVSISIVPCGLRAKEFRLHLSVAAASRQFQLQSAAERISAGIDTNAILVPG